MDDLLALAQDAALAAGDLLLERFATPRSHVSSKSSSTDMVSDADRASEALILQRIRAERPGDAILGEETGASRGSTGVEWIVDPLDGTTNFLFGFPHWAVSIACEDEDGLLAGVVHDPLRAETFAAARGRGATCNGSPIAVTRADDLATALIATGFSYLPEERAAQAAMLEHVITRIRDIRRPGAAALDLAWTAAGRVDGYYEAPAHRWDWAAGVLLVREAGGVAEPMPALGPSGPGMIAAGAALFPALRALADEATARRGTSIEIEEGRART